jgi:hypothetical protein
MISAIQEIRTFISRGLIMLALWVAPRSAKMSLAVSVNQHAIRTLGND